MDAASILLILAAAGQAGWTPDRSASTPPATASQYDRYAQPPAASPSRVAPPPNVADRTRAAIAESGTTLRDGFEAGIRQANEQLQGWTDSAAQQFQSTGNSLRTAAEQSFDFGSTAPPHVGSPSYSFGTATSSPPAKAAKTRGVAPPPWADPSGQSVSGWDEPTTDSAASFGQSTPPTFAPRATENGWTSIGSQIAAPPMLLPQLRTATTVSSPGGIADSGGPRLTAPNIGREPIHSVLNDPVRQQAQPAAGADNWATGWGDNASAPQATISRAASDSRYDNPTTSRDPVANQTANNRPQHSQPPANNWADLWGEQDPWDNSPAAPAAAPNAQTGTSASAPPTNSTNSQPIVVSPAGAGAPPATTGSASTSAQSASINVAPSLPTTDQPPWLPLLAVSLSLAGSLGANLFLGWSYFDARQKYRSLVRKTADKFRSVTAAAA